MASDTALVQALQVLSSHGSGGKQLGGLRDQSRVFDHRRDGARDQASTDPPRRTDRVRFGFTASQNASLAGMPSAASRARNIRIRKPCSSFAFRPFSSAGSKCAGARPIFAKSNSCASASSDGLQLDRIGGAGLREIAGERQRLDAVLAQLAQRKRAEALGQRLAARTDQQREMRERRHARAERLENLDLRRRVGDVILAAHDVA